MSESTHLHQRTEAENQSFAGSEGASVMAPPTLQLTASESVMQREEETTEETTE